MNVENGSYVARVGSLTVDASGDIEGATFTAEAADVVLDADGAILGSTVTAANDATLTAAQIGGVTVDALGAAELTATTGFIANAAVQAGGAAKLVAGTDVSGSDVTAGGDITITATLGSIQGTTALGDGIMTLKAGEEIDGSDFTAADDITVNAKDIAASSFISETGDIHIGTVDNIIGSTIWAKEGAVIIDDVIEELDGMTITAKELTVNANWVVGSTLVAEDGLLKLTATTIDGSELLAKKGNVEVDTVSIISSSVTAFGANNDPNLGNVDIKATGSIVSTMVTADTDITTSGSVFNSSLKAKDDIVLKNAAVIDNLNAVAAKITAVDTIGVITDGSLISAGATTVSAASIRGTAFDAGTVDLTGASDIQGIDVRVNSDAKLSSAKVLDSDVIVNDAYGTITVKATEIDGGSLRADEVSFDEFVAGSDTQIGAASAVRILGAEEITVANGGLVNIVSENDRDTMFTVTASDDVFLTQGNGDMKVDIMADGQTVTLTAAADIGPVASGRVVVTAKDLIITTAQNVDLQTTIEQVKADVAYDFKLVETNDLKIDLVSAGRKAYIQTYNGGSILDSANDTILDIVTPQLTLLASGSIGTATNALDISTQKLTASATSGLINLLNVSNQDVTVDGLTAGTSVTLKTQGSGAHIFDGSVSAYNGDVIIDSAAGDVAFTALSTVLASNNASITAYGDISTEGMVMLEATAGDLSLESKHGSVDLSRGTMAKAGRDLTVAALENDVTLVGGNYEAGRNIGIGAGGNVYSKAVLWAEENVIITAYEEVDLNGPVTANTGEVVVFAETGDLTVNAPIKAETKISLETMDDVIRINDALTAAAVTLTSEKGDILSSATGVVEAATIKANTGGKVDLDGKLLASSWVDIEAIGSVTAADIESGVVKVKTTGSNADIDINLTAGSTDLVARAEDIDSDIFVQGGNLVLRDVYAFDGDVNVTATGAVDVFRAHALDEGEVNGLEDDAHSVFIEAKSVNVRPDGIVADYNAQLDLVIDGNFASNAVLAGHDIIISAGGDIQDSSDDNAYNLIANRDITLRVGGRIGDPAGHNPFDVSAGGKVKVGAIGGSPGYEGGKANIWVFMMGKSGDGSIHYIGDTSTPPGLIWWNGMIWGGAEGALLDIDRSEGGFSREVRDLADRYIAPSWHSNFLYFPHVRAYFDDEPGNMSIEHILDGEGVIEGLPEGVTPTEFNLNDLDDSYTWYDGSK
ncbi:MAG: hypothetical protein BWX73_01747 [Lentisphaerae bacterium ADurb.Bin082]|nr:MAG: hypothetical protein BWX73_01747 [Lentisphaerae bacterium ADurb.Bin082]